MTNKEKSLISIEKLKDHAKGFISYKDFKEFDNITKDIEEYIKELENMKGGKWTWDKLITRLYILIIQKTIQ